MCKEPNHHHSNEKFRKRIQKLQGLSKALHCATRWDIIDIIGTNQVKTKQIRKKLEEREYELSKSGLYYHLTELKEAGVIEVSGYIEEGKGAPEKKWKLTKQKIKINLLKKDNKPTESPKE